MKGFIFSVDAAIALIIVTAVFSVLIVLSQGIHYSSLYYYDQHAYLESVAGTIKHHPLFHDVIDKVSNSRSASNTLRRIIKDVGLSQANTRVTIKVYNETSLVGEISASWPRNSWPSAQDSVSAATLTFAEGNKVGTINVRSW